MMLINDLEKQLSEEISLETLEAVLNRFSTLVRESGSEDERIAFQFLQQHLDKWNIPYKLHQPNLYISIPKKAEIKVIAPDEGMIKAKTPSFSISTGEEWRSGEIVYVPTHQAKSMNDIFGVIQTNQIKQDLKGKIILTEGFPMPGKLPYFTELGAIGAIFISPGQNIHDGICTSIWGAPDLDNFGNEPKIPVLAINQQDGQRLQDLLKNQQVRIEFKTELEKGWVECPLLDIIIEGTEEPEKYVLLHGHVDSWGVGIGDNATGDAALLEMTRLLYKHKDQLKRSVRIALWPGHSTGRYAGSTWFADQFGISLEKDCIAQVNCDSPGCRWATSYQYLEWMSEANEFCVETIKESIGEEAKGVRPLRSGDYSFDNIGITSFLMLSSSMPEELVEEKGYYPVGGCGGNIAWHTEDDVMEIADLTILKKDITMYLAAVTRVANANLLPFKFTDTVQEFISTIKQYQGYAGEDFDFTEVLDEAKRLHQDLQQFYLTASMATNFAELKEFNDKIVKLARIFVPINYTRKGKFRHDPAQAISPLPDIAPVVELQDIEKNSHYYNVLQTHLRRGSNRIIWSFLQAREVVKS
jgi:N-acetylated-alpha-linked acidic dipeptidase